MVHLDNGILLNTKTKWANIRAQCTHQQAGTSPRTCWVPAPLNCGLTRTPGCPEPCIQKPWDLAVSTSVGWQEPQGPASPTSGLAPALGPSGPCPLPLAGQNQPWDYHGPTAIISRTGPTHLLSSPRTGTPLVEQPATAGPGPTHQWLAASAQNRV